MAGIIIASTQTRLASHQTMPVTVYLESDRLKLTMPGMTIIYRADLNRLWAADLRQQVYYELTPETMRQFSGHQRAIERSPGAIAGHAVAASARTAAGRLRAMLGGFGTAPARPPVRPDPSLQSSAAAKPSQD